MSDLKDLVVLDTDPESAQFKSVEGWVSRSGHFYGQNEVLARWDGATHKMCGLHGICAKNSYCKLCHDAARIVRYEKLEKQVWNETDALCCDAIDNYFFSIEELFDYLLEHDDVSFSDLRLLIAEPQYAHKIDPDEIYADLLFEDCELPNAIQAAFDVLNAAIEECGEPLCYMPSDIAVIMPSKYVNDLDAARAEQMNPPKSSGEAF